MENNPNLIPNFNYYVDNLNEIFEQFYTDEKQLIYSLQVKKRTIIFPSSFHEGLVVYCHEYSFDLTPQEIINIEPKKFKDYTNKIITMNEDKTYLIIIKTPKYLESFYSILFKSDDNLKDITISNHRFLYLSQPNIDYNLYFNSNSKTLYIKLCSQTSDAEIEILDNNAILNKNNKYFFLKNNIQKLTLKLKNNNPALIEFFYELENINKLDIKQKTFNIISGNYYIIEVKKSDKIESIKVNLESNNNLSIILYANYMKDNHIGGSPSGNNFDTKNLTTTFLVPNVQLDDDERFSILIASRYNANLSLEFNNTKEEEEEEEIEEEEEGKEKEKEKEEKKDKKKEEEESKHEIIKDDDNNDLPIWAGFLIANAIILILIVLVLFINKCCNRKNSRTNLKENISLLNTDGDYLN